MLLCRECSMAHGRHTPECKAGKMQIEWETGNQWPADKLHGTGLNKHHRLIILGAIPIITINKFRLFKFKI